MCCGSSLTGDLPCAVWLAGVAACVCVLWLFPDPRLPCAVWPAGVAACVCGGSSLISDMPSAVWPDLQIIICFDNLSYCDFLCHVALPLVHCRHLIVE